MEEQRIRSKENTGISEFLVDTAKIRTSKSFSDTSKNGAPCMSNYLCSFANCLEMGKTVAW